MQATTAAAIAAGCFMLGSSLGALASIDAPPTTAELCAVLAFDRDTAPTASRYLWDEEYTRRCIDPEGR